MNYEESAMSRIFRFLSSALAAFKRPAVAQEYRDFDRPFDDVALRDAEYITEEEYTKAWRDHQHDCCSEGCGTSWSTGGERGGLLLNVRWLRCEEESEPEATQARSS